MPITSAPTTSGRPCSCMSTSWSTGSTASAKPTTSPRGCANASRRRRTSCPAPCTSTCATTLVTTCATTNPRRALCPKRIDAAEPAPLPAVPESRCVLARSAEGHQIESMASGEVREGNGGRPQQHRQDEKAAYETWLARHERANAEAARDRAQEEREHGESSVAASEPFDPSRIGSSQRPTRWAMRHLERWSERLGKRHL